MQDEPDQQQPLPEAPPKPRYVTAAAVSAAIHVAVLAVILIGLPQSDPPSSQEEAVSVEIVPPPEPPPEKPPEPPPPEPKAEEPPPPPPPPPPPEKQPEPEKQAAAMQTPVLRPAFQFGEKDSGPHKSPDGDGGAPAAEAPPVPAPQPEQTEVKPPEAPQEREAPPPPEPANDPVPEAEAQKLPELALPEIDQPATLAQGEAVETLAVTEASPQKPKEAPKALPAAQSKTELREVKKLYSTSASGEMVAMMTMAGVSREQRASQLCATELREQLKHGKPMFDPEYLPNSRLQKGNTLQVDLAAFRASGVWYDIRYRCEVDSDATRVTSFSFSVGDKVPRSQWAARRFPTN